MLHRLIANKIIKQTFLCTKDCLIFCAISMWSKGFKPYGCFHYVFNTWGGRRLFCEKKFSIPQWQWEKNFLSPLEVYVSFDTPMLCKIQSYQRHPAGYLGALLASSRFRAEPWWQGKTPISSRNIAFWNTCKSAELHTRGGCFYILQTQSQKNWFLLIYYEGKSIQQVSTQPKFMNFIISLKNLFSR